MKGESDARERGSRMLADAGYGKKRKRGGSIHGGEAKHRPDRRARGGATSDTKEVRGITAVPHMLAGPRKLPETDKVNDLPNDAQGNINARSALARGGRHEGKKGTVINIDASHKGDPEKEQMAKQQGMQQGAQAIAAKLQGAGGGGGGPPRPPMGPPGGPGMPPPGGMPGMPPGMPPGGGMPPPMPPHPPMPPPGAGAPPPGMMPPHPPMRDGGRMRDGRGRYLGGGL